MSDTQATKTSVTTRAIVGLGATAALATTLTLGLTDNLRPTWTVWLIAIEITVLIEIHHQSINS